MTIKSDKNIIKITNPVFLPVEELIKYPRRMKNSGIESETKPTV